MDNTKVGGRKQVNGTFAARLNNRCGKKSKVCYVKRSNCKDIMEIVKILILLFCFKLSLPLYAVERTNPVSADTKAVPKAEAVRLAPGRGDGDVAQVTARMLEHLHYLQPKFNDEISSKFLDRYLNTLDPQHIHFLQSDLADFEQYRAKLDDLTLRGDTTPAYEIATRFLQRLEQRVTYVNELLKTEKLEFMTDERVTLNRRDLPYPKDITEARRLWRDRLRYELLEEKLNTAASQKPKQGATKPKDGSEAKPEVKTTADKDQANKTISPEETREEIVKTLTKRYARILKTFKDWDADNFLEVYLTALAHVYDPHSDYFGKSQLENFAIGMNLSLFGIGAELTSDIDGYCTINKLVPGSPALNSKKIKVKDRIVAVAQGDQEPVDVVGMPLSKVVELIRGPKGTEVRLTIIPATGGDPAIRTTVSLVRDKIKLEDKEAKAKIIEYPTGQGESVRLGIIDLPSFYAPLEIGGRKDKSEPENTTSEDVARLIKKLEQEKVSGIILDLRRNGGGSLEEAIKLTGLFIKEGPVVQVKDYKGDKNIDEDEDPTVLYDGPLVILTSRFSASASEILAGALQDYGRALIVGDASTHGKGTVQSLQQLAPFMRRPGITNNPGALKVTIRKFYRPKGSSTQLKGVVPDIILPSVNDHLEVGESSLDDPLAFDTITSAPFEPLNRVQPYLAELEKNSARRIASEKDFAYVREDIEQVKKTLADKTISLNEKQRLKEKEDNEARRKARDEERLTRKEANEKVYELTLKQVDLPGLPPPLAKTNHAAIAKNANDVKAGNVAANSASATPKKNSTPSGSDLDDEDDEEKPAHVDVDIGLEEAKHILVDYLSLLPKGSILTVTTVP